MESSTKYAIFLAKRSIPIQINDRITVAKLLPVLPLLSVLGNAAMSAALTLLALSQGDKAMIYGAIAVQGIYQMIVFKI